MNLVFRRVKILVVEDEKIIARDIEATIKRLGHEVVGIASTAEEAVKKAGELEPGLILMDITLKGDTDGIEAAKIINDTFDIPVVYLTAHQDEDTIERSKYTNPYGFITKPLDDRDINAAINSAIYRYDVENMLKEAEERYFRLTENAADAIFSQSLEDLTYDYVNKASQAITGYSPTDFYITPNLMEKIVHPEWKNYYEINYRKIIEEKNDSEFEFKIIHKSGEERWLNQRCKLVKDSAGKPHSLEAIVTDVTQRKIYQSKLEETTQKLRAYSNHLQKVREDERLSISREIHDQLGQDLTVLKMDIAMLGKKASRETGKINMDEYIAEFENSKAMIDDIINKVRRIATELRPDILDKLGLADAIGWHAGEFEKRTGIKCVTNLCDPETELDIEKSISLFRVFQETLTNAARHSKADLIDIALDVDNKMLNLTISDNGRGITGEEIEKTSSLGILGMRERILILGGSLDINGVKGKGTTIDVKVPVD